MFSRWKLGTPNNKQFIIGLILSSLYAISSVSLLATSAFLISRAAQMPPILYLMVAVVGVRAFALGRATFRYGERIFLHDGVFRLLAELRPRVFRQLLPLLPAGLGKSNEGKELDLLTSDVEELQNYPLRFLAPLVSGFIALATAFLILTLFSLQAALILLVCGGVFSGLAFLITTLQQRDLESLRAKTRSEISERLLEYLDGVSEFRNLGWGQGMRERIAELGEKQIERDRSNALWLGFGSSILSFAGVFSAFLIAPQSVEAVSSQTDAVFLAVLILLPLAVFELLGTIPTAAIALRKYDVAAKRVLQVTSTAVPKELLIEETNLILQQFSKLEIKDLAVRYPNTSEFAVKGVNLTLRPGNFVAVMGESGKGKTTLALAINSLINPASGHIHVNGKPLQQYSLESRRRVIGLIEQQPHIFSGTLRQNLQLVEGRTDVEITEALEKVGLIRTFNARSGLETELGQRGLLVSGGEAQRIAIARALLADFQVLIVDEPTSALDDGNAFALAKDLKQISHENSIAVLLITHDPKIAKFSDEIVSL